MLEYIKEMLMRIQNMLEMLSYIVEYTIARMIGKTYGYMPPEALWRK